MENIHHLYLSNTMFSQAVKNYFNDIASIVVNASLTYLLIKISMLTNNFFMLWNKCISLVLF